MLDVDIFKGRKWLYRANGGNIGDFVIALSEFDFFEKNGIETQQILSGNKAGIIGKKFDLIYGGGGGFVGQYKNSSWLKRPVSDYFCNKNLNSCIILPSTFYDVDDVVKKFDERFTVFCRDEQSYLYCTELNKRANFLLHDDMAFGLDVSKYDFHDLSGIRSGIVSEARKRLHFKLKEISDFSVGSFLRGDAEKTNIQIPKNNIDLSSYCDLYGESLTRQICVDGFRLFSYVLNKFETIRTNRLHVGIVSVLLGKNVELFDNSYGKIRRVYKSSFDGKYPNVKFVETRN